MTVTERKKELTTELDRIVKLIVEKVHPKKIILFGSLAQDQIREWSDLDLAVIMETNKRIFDRIGDLIEICDPKIAVEFVVYTPEEFVKMVKDEPFVQREIVEKGQVLYAA